MMKILYNIGGLKMGKNIEGFSGKVISVVNTKGGAGKTTIATNLACRAAIAGHKVLLIDADGRQSSSLNFSSLRAEDPTLKQFPTIGLPTTAIHLEIKKYDKMFDLIVIDAGAGDSGIVRSAMLAALYGILIIPVQPSTFDIWGAEDTLRILNDARVIGDIRTYLLLNRVLTNKKAIILKEAIESCEEIKNLYGVGVLNNWLTDYIDFKNCVGAGKCALEYGPNKKAALEFENLYKEIMDKLNEDGE
jgi:chromosome partitioning protein